MQSQKTLMKTKKHTKSIKIWKLEEEDTEEDNEDEYTKEGGSGEN